MFLNDFNLAKVLASLLIFGLNDGCGAMKSSIASKNNVNSSMIKYSNGNDRNTNDQNRKCGDLWKKFHEKVCQKYGHSVLTERIWNKLQEIGMNDSCCAELYISQIDGLFGMIGKIGKFSRKFGKCSNIFELILNNYLCQYAGNSQFIKQFECMFKEETEKMQKKSPQELLDEYWIPEFDVLNFHGREQTKCNIPEEISSRSPEEINAQNDSVLAAYALPSYDYWTRDRLVKEFTFPYVSDLDCSISNFKSVVVNDKNIDKIIFEPGKPLRYYAGEEEIKNLSAKSTLKTSSLFRKIKERSDRAAYFLAGRDQLYLTNFGILLISRVLESFINQAVVSSGLSYQMFDYIEITNFCDPKVEIFKNGKKNKLSSKLYETLCEKLKKIYILNKIG
ncbi:MAG: hypothetical protein J6P21_02830 [Clostridia bacterium]|nr:hypothetical protein [Clostridia bacterium]